MCLCARSLVVVVGNVIQLKSNGCGSGWNFPKELIMLLISNYHPGRLVHLAFSGYWGSGWQAPQVSWAQSGVWPHPWQRQSKMSHSTSFSPPLFLSFLSPHFSSSLVLLSSHLLLSSSSSANICHYIDHWPLFQGSYGGREGSNRVSITESHLSLCISHRALGKPLIVTQLNTPSPFKLKYRTQSPAPAHTLINSCYCYCWLVSYPSLRFSLGPS